MTNIYLSLGWNDFFKASTSFITLSDVEPDTTYITTRGWFKKFMLKRLWTWSATAAELAWNHFMRFWSMTYSTVTLCLHLLAMLTYSMLGAFSVTISFTHFSYCSGVEGKNSWASIKLMVTWFKLFSRTPSLSFFKVEKVKKGLKNSAGVRPKLKRLSWMDLLEHTMPLKLWQSLLNRINYSWASYIIYIIIMINLIR